MIKFDRINFSYDDKKVFENLTLTLEENKFYILMGNNGSGKSTLTKLLLGIESLESGEIFFDNMSVKDDIYSIRKNIGAVFQNPDEQIVSEIVEEEIAFSMENYGYSSQDMNKKIDELLSLTNLEGRREDKISEMSGGEKQRLCIASSLALSPRLLLVDEGTAMLDLVNRKNVLELLKEISNKGVTVVLITHHLNELEYCDEVIYLNHGELKYQGEKFDFISSLIKGEYGDDINLNGSFKIAKNIYEFNNIDISRDIFDIEKVGEHLWNSL